MPEHWCGKPNILVAVVSAVVLTFCWSGSLWGATTARAQAETRPSDSVGDEAWIDRRCVDRCCADVVVESFADQSRQSDTKTWVVLRKRGALCPDCPNGRQPPLNYWIVIDQSVIEQWREWKDFSDFAGMNVTTSLAHVYGTVLRNAGCTTIYRCMRYGYPGEGRSWQCDDLAATGP